MKAGDKLYCHSINNMSTLTTGNIYTILRISDVLLYIKNDYGGILSLTIDVDNNGLSYKNWFIDQSVIRKRKLKQLNLFVF